MVAGRNRTGRLVLWALAFVVTGLLAPTAAQPVPESSGDLEGVELDVSQIREARAAVADNEQLPPDVRARTLEYYDSALKSLEEAIAFVGGAERFDQEAAVAEARIHDLEEELDQPPEPVELALPGGATVEEVEEQLTEARAELAAARQAGRDEEQLSSQRMARRREISSQLGTLSQQLVQIDDEVRRALVTELRPEVRMARQTSLLAQRRLVEAETATLRAELRRHVARAPTLPLRRERVQRRIQRSEEIVRQLSEVAAAKRLDDARRQLAEVRQLAEEASRRVPVVAGLAAETVELAETLSGGAGIRARVEEASRELTDTRRSVSEIRQAFEASQRKWEVVGDRGPVTQWWPTVPVDQERPGQLRQEIREREAQIPEIQHQLILLEDQRAAPFDVQGALAGTPGDEEQADLVRELLNRRRRLLDQLISVSTQYSSLLYELDMVSRELLTETEQLEAFVSARVLWARSVPGARVPAFGDVAGGFGWLFFNPDWPSAWRDMFTQVSEIPLTALGGVAFLALLFAFWPRARRQLEKLTTELEVPNAGLTSAAAKAVGWTLVLAAPVPSLLFLLAALMRLGAEHDLARAAATGLDACGAMAGLFLFIAEACRPRGLVEGHFGWPPALTATIRRNAKLGLLLVLPAVYVSFALREVGINFYQPLELRTWSNALGRVCFTLATATIAILSYRALHPAVSLLSGSPDGGRKSVFLRTAGPWLLAALWLFPAALALLGYYVTAVVLAYFLFRSFLLALGLAVLSGLLHRWEEMKRRDFLSIEARRHELAIREGLPSPETPPETPGGLAVGDAQVAQLSRFGILLIAAIALAVIWVGFLPMLRLLDQVQVWPSVRLTAGNELAPPPQSAAVTSPAAAGNGTADTSSPASSSVPAFGMPGALMRTVDATASDSAGTAESDAHALMLSQLLWSIFLMIVTVVTARNIPGLLETAVLPRLQADRGARSAIGTLIRYGILAAGFSVALALLGLEWSKVQWLAAALTFGLAFGLQEIFANFISGLILLVERPIRVGDAVTIGAITGRVTRIQMRSTTVMGWDRSELIVPNREFITGQLVNWTLSDPRVRIDIPVGVAYGSDVQRVKTALLEAARRHPVVLATPAPEALFLAFGESSLDFELRIFINFRDGRPKVRDQVQVTIEELFRQQNIVVAFPQMDVHLKGPAPSEEPVS